MSLALMTRSRSSWVCRWMFQVPGGADIDHAETLGEHVADIGVAAMHDDLHAVGPAALVAMADDAHVARVVGLRQVGHRYAAKKFGTAIQSIMARSSCNSFHIARSSSVRKFTPRCVPSLRPCSMMRSPIGWRILLYAASPASISSWLPSASASAWVSPPALAIPKPMCGRADDAASPTSATRPNTSCGVEKS